MDVSYKSERFRRERAIIASSVSMVRKPPRPEAYSEPSQISKM